MKSILISVFQFLFLLLFLGYPTSSWGFATANKERTVEFEWDAIPGALKYDIEVYTKGGVSTENRVLSAKSSSSKWEGNLPPGKFLIRLRSRDHRGVPGNWSAPVTLNVYLENIKIIAPENHIEVGGAVEGVQEITFQWKEVKAAKYYQFELTSDDNTVHIQREIDRTELKLTLPVKNHYTWKIAATDKAIKGPAGSTPDPTTDEDLKAELESVNKTDSITISDFTLLGATLAAPKLNPLKNEYVRELSWEPIPQAESYDLTLVRHDPLKKNWTPTYQNDHLTLSKIAFETNWPGGNYQIRLQARAKSTKPSVKANYSFKVKDGDRSPRAEFRELMKKSIDRVEGWYGIASYLITQINYKGQNFESRVNADFSALGGTGRLGVGYVKRTSPWGFLQILDLSGFIYNSSNHTFASIETNGTYQIHYGYRDMLRFQAGVFYKELPVIIPKANSTEVADESKISTFGPHFGIEYWYSISPKMGFQTNAHLYSSLLKISSPNGEAAVPSLSYQIGLLGSYRLTDRWTGLIGIAHRMDKASYSPKTGGNSLAVSGDINNVDVSGEYLNLFSEWAF